MQSSKIIISSLLVLSAIGSALVPSLFQSTNNNQIDSPQVLHYSFNYKNDSLELQVNTSSPAYLFVSVELSNKTFENSSSSLTMEPALSFYYFNSYYKISAGLFTDAKSKSDLTFFIANKTVYQPSPFTVTHKISQFVNKTNVILSSSTQLNLQLSTIDNNHFLQFKGMDNSFFQYNYSTELRSNSLFLKDKYNRTMTFSLSYPTLNNQNSKNSTAFDFTYDYQIENITTLNFNLTVTELSSAQISLNSTIDYRIIYSTSLSSFHQFTFSNLSFTTYQVSVTALTTNKSLSKDLTIAINDTSTPIITKYSISTALTSIKANFTFSKSVKVDYYLTYPNKTIFLTVGNFYNNQDNKLFIVPIGVYNLTLGLIDQFNHHKQYDFNFIKTKQLSYNSSLSFTSNQSVITDKNTCIVLYPIVIFNNTRVFLKDSLNVNISANNILLQHSEIALENASTLGLNSNVLSLYAPTTLTITTYLQLYHLQFAKQIQFVIPTNQHIISPIIALQSYVSNVSSSDIISLHLAGTGFSHGVTAYIDLYSADLHYSLLFTTASISNGQISTDFFLTIPDVSFNSLNLTANIIFGSIYYPTKSYLRLIISNGVDSSLPLANSYTLYNSSQSMILLVNSTKPVQLELFYGFSTNSLTSQIVNSNYQSQFSINLSSILYQDNINYYYFKIHDSNGLVTTYDNNSYYFGLYVPKIDFLAPYNITNFVLDANGKLSFQVNEESTVSINCRDTSGMVGNYQCGQENIFNTIFSIQLQFPLSGLTYVIYQITIQDKACNVKTISLNFLYNT